MSTYPMVQVEEGIKSIFNLCEKCKISYYLIDKSKLDIPNRFIYHNINISPH